MWTPSTIECSLFARGQGGPRSISPSREAKQPPFYLVRKAMFKNFKKSEFHIPSVEFDFVADMAKQESDLRGLPFLFRLAEWLVEEQGCDRVALANELRFEVQHFELEFMFKFVDLIIGDDPDYFMFREDRYGNLIRHT
jgi:hypothetical protein